MTSQASPPAVDARQHSAAKSTANGNAKAEAPALSSQQSMQGTLRAHLTSLQSENPDCVFIARRINRLGFRSREILHRHYSGIVPNGEVRRVLVAHSKVKYRDEDGQVRTRPGGLGLIVMSSAASVLQILALGQTQQVAGHEIR